MCRMMSNSEQLEQPHPAPPRMLLMTKTHLGVKPSEEKVSWPRLEAHVQSSKRWCKDEAVTSPDGRDWVDWMSGISGYNMYQAIFYLHWSHIHVHVCSGLQLTCNTGQKTKNTPQVLHKPLV